MVLELSKHGNRNSTPLINNHIASSTKKELLEVSLPAKTELIDDLSSAGKLIGNGNGMQFFGAILIQSELTLEELNQYYSKYRKNEWSYIVEKQASDRIDFLMGNLKFRALKADEALSNHYIVYSWGSSDYPLSEFDIRGH